MTTRKLCDKCARDTAVLGRCPRLERIDRPGTICDRCLSDGRLLVSYNVCCEPESRFGHTPECKKLRRVATDPTLLRFASALFCTDPRVLTLVGNAYGDGLWDRHEDPERSTCLVLAKNTRIERLGRAWDLAADGHEPEATYRKEAEDRAFQMRKCDRELTAYGVETKRLTRERNAQTALKAGQEANARLAPPMPRAEHEANVAKYRAEEAEQNRAYALKEKQRREEEDERKRQERAARKEDHPQCGAPSPIAAAPDALRPSTNASSSDAHYFDGERCTKQKHLYGDHQFIVNGRVRSGWNANSYYVGDGASPSAQSLRAAEPVLNEHGCVGYVVKRGGRLDLDVSERAVQLAQMKRAGILPEHYPLTDAELAEVARGQR